MEFPKKSSSVFNADKVLTQDSENAPANFIMIHVPYREVFMSVLHPAASLFEGVTDENNIKQCFRNLKEVFKKRGIVVQTVEKALCFDRKNLESLALKYLKYERVENPELDNSDPKANEVFEKYLSYKYKKEEVIEKMHEQQLIDIIFTQPTIKLRKTNSNTFIENLGMTFNPLSNLLFCRDQQITTRKGLVMGRMKSSQRAFETEIMECAYRGINARIIGHVSEKEGGYLEGGDFFVVKPDLSLCGVGLRTTLQGVEYLMEYDLLGTERFGIVYDETDLDQQRMHLDTYFNILNKKWVVALDFDEAQKKCKKVVNRRVFIYSSKEGVESEYDEKKVPKEVKKEVGDYKLIKVYEDFYQYLESEGFNIIKISSKEQEEYMINFLNIGNNTIVSVNPYLESKVKDSGVKVIYVEFEAVQKMYGAVHCATQVAREKEKEGEGEGED